MTKTKKAILSFLLLVCPFFLFACNSGGSGSSASSGDGPGASGTFTINTSGADGGPAGGSGGDGGYVGIYMTYGSMGELQVMASGAANAGFTPSTSTPDLGDNPLYIMVDTTITVEAVEPAAGTPYLVLGSPVLRISDGNATLSDEPPVTGISVASGTTLTFGLNNTTWAGVTLSDDIDNDGTITTEDVDATQRGGLVLMLASYHGNSTIDTSGNLDGQNGGYVEIYPNFSFFNHGTINTSGADSTTGAGGEGGYVQVTASNGIENTGNITADGGITSALAAPGGNAGSLDFQAAFSIFNSGNLSCSGGDGVESGGDGGGMYFYIDFGNLHNSGDLDTSGGAASGAGFGGGFGGNIDIYAYGGEIVNSGNLTAKGGDTTDPSSNGGPGGYIYLYVSYSSLGSTEAPAGDILFSGNVDTSGGLAVSDAGATGSGGYGGSFSIEGDYDSYPLGQRIALLGYSGIDASGGNGNDGGGGGDVELYCDYGYVWLTGSDSPSCNITNEVDINATGGSVVTTATVTPAYGGSGGSVDIWTDEYYGMYDSDLDKVDNSGDIDTSGGDSVEADFTAGNAGYVWIWGFNGVTNSGNIAAGGGHDLGTDGGTTGVGSEGNDLQLFAGLGPVSNSGNLTTNGGDGEYSGGNAYAIWLFGPEVSNSGALAASGGDADPLLAGSVGGDGADVDLFSPDGLQGITQTGGVTNDGGIGETPGADGSYYLGVAMIP